MMRRLFATAILCLLMGTAPSFGQSTEKREYFDWEHEVCDSIHAAYFTITKYKDADSLSGSVEKYTLDGQVLYQYNYSNIKKHIQSGNQKKYYDNGQLSYHGQLDEGLKDGLLKTYYEDGQLRRDDIYKSDELVEGRCYTSNGSDTTWFPYMVMPLYPGGESGLMKDLSKNTKYPNKSSRKRVSGTVYVTFVVNKQGEVEDARVIRSVDKKLDAEALRVVNSMPDWEPAYQDGVPVSVQYNLPIRFTLR